MTTQREPERGWSAVTLAANCVTLFIVGFMAGINAWTESWIACGALVGVGAFNVIAQIRLYRSSMGLIRVQERLKRGAGASGWVEIQSYNQSNPAPPPAPPRRTP